MIIRRSTLDDVDTILSIYEYARQQMRLSGNPNQWSEDYPSEEIVRNDILNGNSYLIVDGDTIGGVFVFIIGEDPTYMRIEDGSWLNGDPYGTIHRIAGNGRMPGIFRICLKYCESRISNIRIDTHRQNQIMQHLIESSGFQKCGWIYVADGSERIAYQKVV